VTVVLFISFVLNGQEFQRREIMPSVQACFSQAAEKMTALLKGHGDIDQAEVGHGEIEAVEIGCMIDKGKPA
jgi:hypothetical protein